MLANRWNFNSFCQSLCHNFLSYDLFSPLIAMDDTYQHRLGLHRANEFQQVALVSVGAVAAYGFYTRVDSEVLAIQFYITVLFAETLDIPPRSPLGLVADKNDVVSRFAQHGF